MEKIKDIVEVWVENVRYRRTYIPSQSKLNNTTSFTPTSTTWEIWRDGDWHQVSYPLASTLEMEYRHDL
jgi:hypothetical protein